MRQSAIGLSVTEERSGGAAQSAVQREQAATLAQVTVTQARIRQAEAELLTQVVAVCDLYSRLGPEDAVNAHARDLHRASLLEGPDGTPAVHESAGHELGPALGTSPGAAWSLIWDALALRHRHPVLWDLTLAGEVEICRARRVAKLCVSLSEEHARQLDSELGPRIPAWGPVTTQKQVEQARARLDPALEAERQAARRSRRVNVDRHPAWVSVSEVHALLNTEDAAHLNATLNTLAEVLARGGTDQSRDELRAVALGHLAHPDRASLLLSEDLRGGAAVTPDGHIVNTTTGEIVTRGGRPGRCRHGAQIIVHLAAHHLATNGAGDSPTLGTVTRGHLEQVLAGCAGRVDVKPVIDLEAPLTAAVYRPPAHLKWIVNVRDRREAYPYSERRTPSRGIDLDHTIPWAQGGATSTSTLAPLTRRTHRLKTHAGFDVIAETPGGVPVDHPRRTGLLDHRPRHVAPPTPRHPQQLTAVADHPGREVHKTASPKRSRAGEVVSVPSGEPDDSRPHPVGSRVGHQPLAGQGLAAGGCPVVDEELVFCQVGT